MTLNLVFLNCSVNHEQSSANTQAFTLSVRAQFDILSWSYIEHVTGRYTLLTSVTTITLDISEAKLTYAY